MAVIDIQVPDIGDFDEVGVIEVLVKVGDTIRAEQSLVTVESDKASMEIPSSHAGVVKELKVKLGDKVAMGSVLLTLEVAGEVSAPAPAATQKMSKIRLQRPSVLRKQLSKLKHPATLAAPNWTATCWCWAAAPAATVPRSAPPTWV